MYINGVRWRDVDHDKYAAAEDEDFRSRQQQLHGFLSLLVVPVLPLPPPIICRRRRSGIGDDDADETKDGASTAATTEDADEEWAWQITEEWEVERRMTSRNAFLVDDAANIVHKIGCHGYGHNIMVHGDLRWRWWHGGEVVVR